MAHGTAMARRHHHDPRRRVDLTPPRWPDGAANADVASATLLELIKD
jgi:hypothetical protein